MLIMKITNNQIKKIEQLPYFVHSEEERELPYNLDNEAEDDNAIHITRGGVRFVFFNGQEKGRFTKKDIKRFALLVDTILKSEI